MSFNCLLGTLFLVNKSFCFGRICLISRTYVFVNTWSGQIKIDVLCLGKNRDVSSFTIWAASWQNQQNECAPSEDSDQPGHPPSLIRVFTVRKKKAWVLSYPLSAQRRLWSDWADAQADLSLRWAHRHFVSFVMTWLNYNNLLILRVRH